MDLVVTYDISTTNQRGVRRLERIAKICEGYGTRVQYSVFECRLSGARYVRLVADLLDAIDNRADSINIYHFSGDLRSARRSLGRRVGHELGDPWIM